jgi:molecular chaperone GrpE (heat shock protein)
VSDDVLRKLEELHDLFQRRLLEDKTSRQILAELTERTQWAEAGLFRQYLYPLINGLAHLIDRLDRYESQKAGQDEDFVLSIRAELLDTLSAYGITEVDVNGTFDPVRHKAVGTSTDPTLPDRTITASLRRGYAHRDWVFRPAHVVVNQIEQS